MSYPACTTPQDVTAVMNAVLGIHSKFLAGDVSVPDANAARLQTAALVDTLEVFELNFEVVAGLEVYTDQERLGDSTPERLTYLYPDGSSLVHITRYYKVCTNADKNATDPKQALVFTASFTDHPNGSSLVLTSSIDVLNVDTNQLNDGVCSGLKLTKIRDHECIDEIVLLTCEKDDDCHSDNGYHSDDSCDIVVKVKQEGKPTEIVYSTDPYAHYDNCDDSDDDDCIIVKPKHHSYETDLPALTGLLSGEAEVDDSVTPPVYNQGDLNGKGSATVTPICVFEKKVEMEIPNTPEPETITALVKFVKAEFELKVKNIEEPNRFHIHQGEINENGPVVVTFFDLLTLPPIVDGVTISPSGASGTVEIELDVYELLVANPQGYYFNVHNEEFPAGALRSQLFCEPKKDKKKEKCKSKDKCCKKEYDDDCCKDNYDHFESGHDDYGHDDYGHDDYDHDDYPAQSYEPCYMWKDNVATHYWDGEAGVYVECAGYSGDNYHFYCVGDGVYEMCNFYFDGKDYHDVEGVYVNASSSSSHGHDDNDYGHDDNDYGHDNNDYGHDDNDYDYDHDNNDYGHDNNDYSHDDAGSSYISYYYYCPHAGEYYEGTHGYDGTGYYQTDYNDQYGGYEYCKQGKTFHKCTHKYEDGEYKPIHASSSSGGSLFNFYNS